MLLTELIIILVCFHVILLSFADDAEVKDNISYWYPTDDELESGYAYHAYKWWGARVRKDKKLKIAFVGGSQTYFTQYPKKLGKLLKEYLGATWDVKTYNEGASGMGPSLRIFLFELLPISG